MPEDQQVETFGVWKDNWSTLKMFLRLESQWHILAAADGENQHLGIRRGAIEFELRYTDGFPRRIWNRVKDDLISMEAAALKVLSSALDERRKKRLDELNKR